MSRNVSMDFNLNNLSDANSSIPTTEQRGRFTVINEPEVEVGIRDGFDSDDYFSSDDDGFGFGFSDDDKAAEEKEKETEFIYNRNNNREVIIMPKNWETIKRELKKIKDSLFEKNSFLHIAIGLIINSKSREEIKHNINEALRELKNENLYDEYNKLMKIYKKVYSNKVGVSNLRKKALRTSRISRTRRGGKKKKTRKRRKTKRRTRRKIRKRRRKSGRKITKRRRKH